MKFNKIILYTLILALLLNLAACRSNQGKENNIEQRVQTSIQETTQFLEVEIKKSNRFSP